MTDKLVEISSARMIRLIGGRWWAFRNENRWKNNKQNKITITTPQNRVQMSKDDDNENCNEMLLFFLLRFLSLTFKAMFVLL